jgi:hypothetical protein
MTLYVSSRPSPDVIPSLTQSPIFVAFVICSAIFGARACPRKGVAPSAGKARWSLPFSSLCLRLRLSSRREGRLDIIFDFESESECHRIIGFRNILIHGYDIIDERIVWKAVKNHLPILYKEIQQMLGA